MMQDSKTLYTSNKLLVLFCNVQIFVSLFSEVLRHCAPTRSDLDLLFNLVPLPPCSSVLSLLAMSHRCGTQCWKSQSSVLRIHRPLVFNLFTADLLHFPALNLVKKTPSSSFLLKLPSLRF